MTALDKVKKACLEIEELLSVEPSLVLCERELQILLQQKLLDLFPEKVDCVLKSPTYTPQGLTREQLTINRVFRELNLIPTLGRNSPKPDIVVVEKREQTIIPKQNNAPSSFIPPFSCIIETKVAINWSNVFSSNTIKKKNGIKMIMQDIEKYKNNNLINDDISSHFIFIILTQYPEIYSKLSTEKFSILTIKYPHVFHLETTRGAEDDFDYKSCIKDAIKEIHDLHKAFPLLMLREKDFETFFVHSLRKRKIPYVPAIEKNGEIKGYINPVRSQWVTPNDGTRTQRRVHDVIILKNPVYLSRWQSTQNFLPIYAEFELKTSNSNSHNWFRKNGLKKELEYMSDSIKRGDLLAGYFLMFRFGEKRWKDDADQLTRQFNRLKHYYLSSHS